MEPGPVSADSAGAARSPVVRLQEVSQALWVVRTRTCYC